MATIKVLDRYVDVDVYDEINQYDWRCAKWTEDKLIACSPFRDDSRPSFWVSLTGEYAGVFGDSAYDNDYYKAGGLPKLLAYLRDESYEEACAYLLEKYDYDFMDGDIEITTPKINLLPTRNVVLPQHTYDKPIDNDYLIGRGIHPSVIKLQGVFDNGDHIGIPWRNMRGEVCAIKYRHKKSKYFWYEDDATPLARLVYGLDVVVKRGISRIAICEAEIDAMTWQSAGIYAVAIGGARFNEKQADMIVQSGVSEIILAGDNDVQGRKFNDRVAELLNGRITLKSIDYSTLNGCKDVNDLGMIGIKGIKITNLQRKGVHL